MGFPNSMKARDHNSSARFQRAMRFNPSADDLGDLCKINQVYPGAHYFNCIGVIFTISHLSISAIFKEDVIEQ